MKTKLATKPKPINSRSLWIKGLGLLCIFSLLAETGCSNPVRRTSTARGAARGAVGGAVIGGASGGNAKKGAAAGAAIGGVSGRRKAVRRGW